MKVTTMPTEKVMSLMAEAVAEIVREKLMNGYEDIVHDAVGDTMLEFLGENAHEDDEDAYMDVMMELSSRIAVVAV
jgi:hypothetical protein